jgi:CRP/FNR family transcriptional regulator, cyclic AMP receptor protein
MNDGDTDNHMSFRPPGPTHLVCNKGQAIFEQGMPAHQAFYVEEGRVEVTVEEDGHIIKLAEIGPGEIFGEMGVLEQEARMATVRAIEKSIVAIISKVELEERIKNIDDPVVQSLIGILLSRVRSANRGQVKHYKDLADFQNRIAGLMRNANEGIDATKRDAFRAEILPLLDKIEAVLTKYRA